MKNIKDLKDDIMNKRFQKFYVFYGEDYGLRNHYIKEIAKQFNNKVNLLFDLEGIRDLQTGSGLFRTDKLYVVHGDFNFARMRKDFIEEFIKKLKHETVILCFEEEQPNTILFKEFSDYITYFPIVQDNIAIQFAEMELSLDQDSKETLIKNCGNNYNNILLEADKIKNYAQAKNISHQMAYDELYIQQQLLYKPPVFHSYEMMNDVLKGNYAALGYWYQLAYTTFLEDFWTASESIMNDLLIAYMIVKDGRYNGSNKAYDLKFKWERVKVIRDFVIPYSAEDLLYMAYQVADLDAKVKGGKLEAIKALDYFMCLII